MSAGIKGRMVNLTRGLDGEYQLTIATRDRGILQVWDELHEHDITAALKRWRPKRSLDANAYCWVLIDRLAERLNRSKEEIYREAIRGIGGVSTTVCVRNSAVGTMIEAWQQRGLGWFADTLPSKLEGCTNVVLYFGSSTYDSAQMAALIDHIVQDCKAVGVETLPPHELAALESAWAGRAWEAVSR